MIARLWSARLPAVELPAYRRHIEERVLPVLKGIEGYKGAELLQRPDGEAIEVVVVTWWTSLDAIRAFAGNDVEHAVVADEVRPLLSAWDRRVRHYDVALRDEP
ncbi:MAG TPA: antibiotic biosynthesis monooxygenase [Vicinamibacterales bacterium]|jgi:heme-degrading monooxygenase HmoA|nr:antibiotic biosynthesis monooxygenase [Vicinamibacterales bacterium]